MTFSGWKQPKENWSRLPHEFIENMPVFSSKAEICVVLYVLRHTWGYGDDYKQITIDEFRNGRKYKDGRRMDSGTGMSLNAIRSGIEQAVRHGFLKVVEDNKDMARIKRYYSLSDFCVAGGSTLDVQKLGSRGSKVEPLRSEVEPRTEKETNRKKLEERKELSPNGGEEPQAVEKSEKTKASSSGGNSQVEIDTAVTAMLEAWGRLFPKKPQPRPTTYRKKIATRWGNAHFRENWIEAMELAAASPTCQKKSWFRFEFFVRNDENYQKCLDRWMGDFDAKLDNPHANGRTSSIVTPKEMDWDAAPDAGGPRFMTADNFVAVQKEYAHD